MQFSNRYTICEEGTANERQCPNDLHFNMKIKQCDRPQNAGCLKNDVNFDCSAQEPLDLPLFADPEDCRFYFACANGVATRLPCPKNTSWNQVVQNCVSGSASCKAGAGIMAVKRLW